MINPYQFDELIAPLTPKQFFEDYWEKKPLLLNENRGGYLNFLTLKDIDFLLFSLIPNTSGSQPWVRFFNNKKMMELNNYLNKSGAFVRSKVMEAFRQGDTIELIHPEDRYEPLKRFCSGMEKIIGHKVLTEIFLTPPHSQGFGDHYDAYDNFILQLEGKKHWKLYDVTIPFPIVPNDMPYKGNLPPPVHEIELKKGDLLYVPRGLVHEAHTDDDLSLHISVAVHTTKWVDLIHEVIANEMDFRKALPVGALNNRTSDKIPLEYFDKIKDLFSDRDKIEKAFKYLQLQYTRAKNTPFDLSFGCKEQKREITPDTIFKKRDGVICTHISNKDETIIYFDHEEISAPSHIEPSLEHIISSDRFSIRTMPDSLTESGKIALVKALMKSGLLEIDSDKQADEGQ